ncbi:Oidioi.mRNA.OKI2018_I69.chr2.g5180.t1.cds [Oikopleura dioica]|uniref:Oidioi.mRNA.OKI2018_I69.chr2.g5180.t1.cds n=1 Tax=Oikopleura dioica TaxID=34765 RepID=A0ABN7SZ66_OIKDI|nr:Oidioi.mRNA.OKI2018_I69.chr2.g5180.t1.cds [Oikopleura dioica]
MSIFAIDPYAHTKIHTESWKTMNDEERLLLLYKYTLKCETDAINAVENQGKDLTADLYQHILDECHESPILTMIWKQ